MSSVDQEKRDRVRELVRQILKSVPEETLPADSSSPQHVVVNSIRERVNREFDRDESSRAVITEDDLRGLEAGARVRVARNVKFTPLAHDIIIEKSLQLINKESRNDPIKVRSAAIGADHGGFAVKDTIKQYLEGLGVIVRDLGTNSTEPVDYPDFAHAVARAVSDNQADIGIIVDGAGIGSAMAANKVPNIRAAACYSTALAKNSREHNGANVLTLGSGQNSVEEMKDIVNAFITSEISEDRHKKRVGKINAIEDRYKR